MDRSTGLAVVGAVCVVGGAVYVWVPRLPKLPPRPTRASATSIVNARIAAKARASAPARPMVAQRTRPSPRSIVPAICRPCPQTEYCHRPFNARPTLSTLQHMVLTGPLVTHRRHGIGRRCRPTARAGPAPGKPAAPSGGDRLPYFRREGLCYRQLPSRCAGDTSAPSCRRGRGVPRAHSSSAGRCRGEMNIASHGYSDLGDSLPAIVERARQDRDWHNALARIGYRRVKEAYAKQVRDSPKDDVFYGMQHLNLWPTMEFVRVWLKSEKKRLVAKVRWTFVAAMLATITGVLTFTAALSVLR